MYGWRVAMMTLRLEMCPAAGRPTSVAAAALCFGVAMLAASLLSAALWHLDCSFKVLCLVAGVLLAASAIILGTLSEPRARKTTP
jgi:hypothetical protein